MKKPQVRHINANRNEWVQVYRQHTGGGDECGLLAFKAGALIVGLYLGFQLLMFLLELAAGILITVALAYFVLSCLGD